MKYRIALRLYFSISFWYYGDSFSGALMILSKPIMSGNFVAYSAQYKLASSMPISNRRVVDLAWSCINTDMN